VLSAFRALVQRAGLHKIRTANEKCFSLSANSEGGHIRAASAEIAIEQQLVGEYTSASFLMPISALDAWDRRGDDLIDFEPQTDRDVRVSWSDRGVPRQALNHVGSEAKVEFPELPTSYSPNDVTLWPALRDAVANADRGSARYALNCLHLRGALGRIDATDGRHVLSQCGYRFGSEEDLLVPAHAVLGCRELAPLEGILVGQTSDWLGIRIGQFSVMLRIEKEGRFPKIDDMLASHEHAPSRLEFELQGRDLPL